ncbi:outer membrane beta-barrel protein [Roseivirga pacifica]|uniref:outer membrane beta-barrel protein n=1 Tax=Roseivirga pacifica TaxID=1267423 RepID=UPI003BAA8391
MKARPYFLIVSLMAICSMAQAQFWVIKGTVLDSAEQKPLQQSTVVLLNQQDSTMRAFSTDLEGQFRITGVADGNYQLAISFVGFKSYQIGLEVQGKSLDLGNIILAEDFKSLDEVTVEGLAQRVVQNGDTTEMIASAFKTNPDATAGDLLEKMPGIVVQNGTVQAQGETVQRVLVDGREFFGDDPNAALQNLPAEIIERIQVYDQASDQAQFTGFTDGETTKTLNIITKASMRNGEFGKVYGGVGTDERYNVGGSINLFREKSRTTILAQTNNINIQNFSTSDLLGITAGGRRGGGRGGRGGGGGAPGGGGFSGGSNTSDFLVGQESGISETKAFGINYSYEPTDKLKLTASYFFNQSDNNANEQLWRNYTLPENEGQTYDELSLNESTNINHRFSAELEYKIDDKNSILVRPRLTLQNNSGISSTSGQTMSFDDLLNESNTSNSSDLTAYTFSNNLLYRHAFEKRGRTFSINLNTNMNGNTGDAYLLSENIFYADNDRKVNFNQNSDLLQDGLNLRVNATYTEPLTDKSQLLASYQYGYQYTDSDKETYDFNEGTGEYSDLNTTLSNTFKSDYVTHSASLGYNLRGTNANLSLRGTFQNANLDNEQTFPLEGTTARTFNNFLPTANYRYRFSRGESLSINYRTSTDAPSVTQLQNVIDNTDPLNISAGNPTLDQAYQHAATVRYNKVDMESSSNFFTMFSGTYSDNYIGNTTVVAGSTPVEVDGITLEPGARYSKPTNLSGYWNIRSFISYGLPLGGIKSNLNFTGSLSYNKTPEVINDELNYAKTPTAGLGLVLSSNISEKVDFTLSSNSSFSNVTNTLDGIDATSYFTQSSRLRMNLIFGKDWVYRTTVNHTLYSGLSEGYNQNFVLWNMELGKKIIQQKAEIKLSVFDLLKQNQSISRSVTGSYIQDSQTQILTQYFMLSFVFNIRSFGQGEAPQLDDRMQRMQEMRQRFGRG